MKTQALGLLLVAVASAASFGAARRDPATVHTVIIDATSFTPARLRIKPGDSVVWRNRDVIPHTATSGKKGGFDSGTLASGDSWKFTFKAGGEYPYLCSFHPTMKATIVVSP